MMCSSGVCTANIGRNSDFITEQQLERVRHVAADYAQQLVANTLECAFDRMAARSRQGTPTRSRTLSGWSSGWPNKRFTMGYPALTTT
jgi:Holliday junction resolvase-like predicted endonuclease